MLTSADFPDRAIWRQRVGSADGVPTYREVPVQARLIEAEDYERSASPQAVIRVFLLPPDASPLPDDFIEYENERFAVRLVQRKYNLDDRVEAVRCLCGSVLRQWGYR